MKLFVNILNNSNLKTVTIDGDRIGFFFGAGASVEFGIPSMKKITELFKSKINKENKNEEKDLFNSIYNSLEEIYGTSKVDLELIMSVIVGLKETSLLDSIGDLGLFLLQQKGIKNITDIKYDLESLKSLEESFKKFIRSKITLKTKGIDRLRERYFDFFKQLCQIINCNDRTNELNEKSSSNTYCKWVFFTTNYDNILEEYWINFRKYTILDLGFYDSNRRRVMNPEQFVTNNRSNSYSAMQLIKLHGSINWIRNSKKQIEEHEYNTNIDNVRIRGGSKDFEDDIIIYPLNQKQLYFSPYIQLFRILGAELDKRELWVIIGYSFRDSIIRNMFEKSLIENKSHRLLLVHPHPEEIKKLFSQTLHNQIFEIKDYFGKKNYKKVNKNIVQKLTKIC